MAEKSKNQTSPHGILSAASDGKKKKPYVKPTLEKHSDTQLWAFGTMGG